MVPKEQLDAYQRASEGLKSRITQEGTQSLIGLHRTEDWENFWRAYDSISINARMKSFRYNYTKEGIRKFAAWCDYRMKVGEIIEERREAEQKKQEQAQTPQK